MAKSTKKAATKKAPAKSATVKKAATSKAATKKVATKKASVKKAAAAVKKVATKKGAAATKKSASKTSVKKVAAPKKAATKKAAVSTPFCLSAQSAARSATTIENAWATASRCGCEPWMELKVRRKVPSPGLPLGLRNRVLYFQEMEFSSQRKAEIASPIECRFRRDGR